MKFTVKVRTVISFIIVVLLLPANVFSERVERNINVSFNDIKIEINGNLVTPRDAQGNLIEPFSLDGTTYLPLRAIAEALGRQVTWDQETLSIFITRDVFGKDITGVWECTSQNYFSTDRGLKIRIQKAADGYEGTIIETAHEGKDTEEVYGLKKGDVYWDDITFDSGNAYKLLRLVPDSGVRSTDDPAQRVVESFYFFEDQNILAPLNDKNKVPEINDPEHAWKRISPQPTENRTDMAQEYKSEGIKDKTITVLYGGIKIYIDNTLIHPKDVQGRIVEPFGYNGTNYLPVRAVAEALGKNVSWDGTTHTVIIKDKAAGDAVETTVPQTQPDGLRSDNDEWCNKLVGVWERYGEDDVLSGMQVTVKKNQYGNYVALVSKVTGKAAEAGYESDLMKWLIKSYTGDAVFELYDYAMDKTGNQVSYSAFADLSADGKQFSVLAYSMDKDIKDKSLLRERTSTWRKLD